jgi:hypothetical protein
VVHRRAQSKFDPVDVFKRFLCTEEGARHQKTTRDISIYDKGSKYGKKKRRLIHYTVDPLNSQPNDEHPCLDLEILEDKY